jgi:peptidylprolyl isomerase
MKLRLLAAALAAFTLTGAALAQDMNTDKGKLSYALGYQLGREAAESGEALDVATMTKALQDGYAKKDPAVPMDQMRGAYQGMQQRLQAKAKSAYDKASADNKTKSDAFLAQNKAKSGVKTLPNGVQYRVMEAGSGAKPTQASTVDLEVAGAYPWGQHCPAGAPQPCQEKPPQKMTGVKVSGIEMPAMREVLLQMPAGAKWEIALPPEKAYGADPRSGFPPNVAVVFEVKLVSVK